MRGIDDALEHIVFLAKRFGKADEEFILKILLIEIGIPTRLDGFNCIQDAIMYLKEHPEASLSKEVYPALAKLRGIYYRPVRVEGTIRCAISSAYKHRDSIWTSYFPGKKRPSNGEFLSRMVKMLEIWKDCTVMEERRVTNEETG